jgi:hypothetical protein
LSANLPQPKCRIEIFREPGFFDDNFVKGWTVISGSFATNGEYATIIGFAAVGRIEKNVPSLNTSLYTRIQVRVKSVSGTNTTWGVKVYSSSGVWYTVWTGQTSAGIFEAYTPSGITITKIALLEEYAGDTSNRVEFDYVAICKNPLLTPVTETLSVTDAIESLEITLPILSRGLAGAKFKLPNFNGQYTGKVKEHDIVLIWLYRTDETFTKVFGGRVSKVTYEGIAGGPQYYIYVECMDHGWELQVPPALVQKAYTNTNGKTIIKDAVAVCSYLTDYGVDQSNAIASTHSYVFDEKTPWNVIREVADACQTSGGAVGFDGYVDPAGNFWIFPRGSNNSTVDLTDKIIRYKVEYDTYRVKNKIKVYGRQAKILGPLDESTSNWSSSGTVSLDSGDVMEGSYSIKATRNSNGVNLRYHFSNPISCKFSGDYKKLHLWVKVSADNFDNNAEIYVQLFEDYNNFIGFVKYFKTPSNGKWIELEIPLGPGMEWLYYLGIMPNWQNINDLEVKFMNGYTVANLTLKLDGVRFIQRYSSTVENLVSEVTYGTRMPEPTVDDSLQSDAECTNKAQSLLSYYQDKVTTLTVETFGNNAFRPGDMQSITLSNDNISGSFRILEITHTLQDVFWKTELLMSNEPLMIDYIFRSMFQKQKQLEINI